MTPDQMPLELDHAQEQGMSERRACRLVNQPRGTQLYPDEELFLHCFRAAVQLPG